MTAIDRSTDNSSRPADQYHLPNMLSAAPEMAHASQLDADIKRLLAQVSGLSQEVLTQQPASIGKVYVQCSVLSVAESIHFPYLQKQLALTCPKPVVQAHGLALCMFVNAEGTLSMNSTESWWWSFTWSTCLIQSRQAHHC